LERYDHPSAALAEALFRVARKMVLGTVRPPALNLQTTLRIVTPAEEVEEPEESVESVESVESEEPEEPEEVR